VKIVLWPKGKISGSLRWAEASKDKRPFPTSLTASTLARRKAGAVGPKGVMTCPVDSATGRWVCELPTATYDLSASVEGFVPRYLWDVVVSADKTLDTGALTLQRGGSLVAWVEADGPLDPATCRARLSVLQAAGAPPDSQGRTEVAATEQPVPKNGFLQFSGLAPGAYALEVRQDSYSPVRVTPIRIVRDGETSIEKPVVLRRPLPLELAVEPPLDWLGKTWSVRVARQSELTRSAGPAVFSGLADEQGRVVIPEQAAGRFMVSVADSLGNRLYHELDWEVEGPEDLHRTISIAFLTVRGTIFLGKQPLPAILWFGGSSGAMAVRMESDAEGRFHGVLPKEGPWTVEIEGKEPRFRTQTPVRVEANGAGKASLDIVLPDTRLFGRVLQEGGRPAAGARVLALQGPNEILIESGEAGEFDLRGFPSGLLQLAATFSSAEEGASSVEGISMPLVEGQTVGPLELRLRRLKAQAGQVVSVQGPVAGALVEMASLGIETPWWKAVTTELDGSFTVRIPAGAQRLQAVVSAPGKSLRAFEFPAGPGPVSLSLADAGGTLEVYFAKAPAESSSARFELYQNGLLLPLSTVWKWLRGQGVSEKEMHGTEIRIPQLAPGDYRACVVVWAESSGAGEAASPPGKVHCDAGTLSIGGTLRLRPTITGP
jgi:hypothetical protein